MSSPLISCICVTKEELALPVHCFWQQSYDNLELVVVHEQEEWPELEAVAAEDPRIRSVYIPLEPKLALPALYNKGVFASYGDYFIVWDSDDWSAPTRVRAQYEHMIAQKKRVCTLKRWTVYDRVDQRAKVSKSRLWEGSLLMDVNIFPRYPEEIPRSFDTQMVSKLGTKRFAQLDDPEQMLYVLHDSNVNGRQHAEGLLKACGSECKPQEVEEFEHRLLDAASDFADFMDSIKVSQQSEGASIEERSVSYFAEDFQSSR